MRPSAKTILIVLAVIAIGILIWSVAPWAGHSDTEAPPAPHFGSTVSVSNARLIMPAKAGEPAALYFDLSNKGSGGVALRKVAVEHAANASIAHAPQPVDEAAATLNVSPGETVSLGPEGAYVAVSGYDSSVVPGAVVKVQLGFGTSATLDTTAQVQSAVGQNGRVNDAVTPD